MSSEFIDLKRGPAAIDWNFGTLPSPEIVPYDCVLVLWTTNYIGLVLPWGDENNLLRWCDDHYFPRWGYDNPEGWWVYTKKGSQPRPDYVKTWEETYPDKPKPR